MTQNDYEWSVKPLEQVMALWDNPNLIYTTPQGAGWVQTYAVCVNPGTIVIIASLKGVVHFFLPLEVVHKATLAAARFPGGSHANENFAPATKYFCENPPADLNRKITMALRTARPDIDLIVLERLLPELDGIINPLVFKTSTISPNVALKFKLEPEFATLLAKHNGSKRLKKMRQMDRRMQDRGGWRTIRAKSQDEVDRLFDAYFALKTKRFKEMGVKDVFGDIDVRTFFRQLYRKGLTSGEHELHGLEVGGEITAVTGCSVRGPQFTAEFGGISNTDRQLSPGDNLYHKLIEECCNRGFEMYNFSVGDEFYKRRWCDIEVLHRDSFMPLSLKGRLAAIIVLTLGKAKRAVKSNEKLYSLIKKIRGAKSKALEQD